MGQAAKTDFFPFRSVRPTPQTAKPPCVGPVAQTSHLSIPLSIPADREEVIVIPDGKRFESTLDPMSVSRGLIMNMLALGVCQA